MENENSLASGTDTTNLNDEELAVLESSDFTLDKMAANYSAELYTQSYIKNLFTVIDAVCTNYKTIVDLAKPYFSRTVEIANSNLPPEITKPNLETTGISLTTIAPQVMEQSTYTKGTVNIKSGTLNIRDTPNGEIVGSATKGQTLKVIGKSEEDPNWLKVRLEDETIAYVSAKYVTLSNVSKDNVITPSQVTTNENLVNQNLKNVDTGNIENTKTSEPIEVLTTTPLKNINTNQETTSHSSYQTMTVNTESGKLNVRLSPNGEVISTLNKGQEVKVIGQSEDNPNWTKVLLEDGKEAYVFSKYLK